MAGILTAKLVALREMIRLKDAKYEVQFKSLETALQAQLIALRENTALAFTASEKAIQKADLASEKRFESVNEFRKTLTDQTATFMPRPQVEQLVASVNSKVDALVVRVERSEGRDQGRTATVVDHRGSYAMVTAAISILIALVSTVAYILLAHRPR